jgi:hypothetical protein
MGKKLENAMNLYLEGIRDGRVREAATVLAILSTVLGSRTVPRDLSSFLNFSLIGTQVGIFKSSGQSKMDNMFFFMCIHH